MRTNFDYSNNRLMVLSKWIAIPLVLMIGVVLVFSYVLGYSEYSFWLIPLVVALAVLYVLHPEIDRWYIKKNPVKLPKGMLRFIEDHVPAYRLMNSSQKKDFESATSNQCVDAVSQVLNG